MKSIAYDPFVKRDSPALAETGATLASSLEEALGAADFISVHSPLTPETKHMFNRALFAKVKPGAGLVNTSRGGVIDESALLEALQSGRLAGAALDVREKEPPVVGELEKMDNVILAPHIAAFTAEAQARTYEAVAGDIDRLLSGEPAKNFVNRATPERRG
jgi:phosphoglycerate dehydrogenase-like enzyme